MAQNGDEKVESVGLVIGWVKEMRGREDSRTRCEVLAWTAGEEVVSLPDKSLLEKQRF